MSATEKAERITITLPPDMLGTIKRKVQGGAYGSTSEVIREAMRDWQHKQEERELQLAALRERLERSANSGEGIPMDEAFDQVRQRILEDYGEKS